MKSFHVYSEDPKPMTAKRFWASMAFGWLLTFAGLPIFGMYVFLPIALITLFSIVVILWRVANGDPAFPQKNKPRKIE